jgi:hypothetical protein
MHGVSHVQITCDKREQVARFRNGTVMSANEQAAGVRRRTATRFSLVHSTGFGATAMIYVIYVAIVIAIFAVPALYAAWYER